MSMMIEDFAREFFQEVVRDAETAPQQLEESLFEKFGDVLVEQGEIPTADPSAYWHRHLGIRVDGYGGDPLDDNGTLSLVVADFEQSDRVARLTQTRMNLVFRRLDKFVRKALDGRWRNSIEETSPGFRLADLLVARWSRVQRIRMFLVSNRLLSDRVDGRPAGALRERPVTYSVWDIGRLHRLETARGGREELFIDFARDFGGALPMLPAHLGDAEYESFLAVLPGPTLAAIYDRWGPRLLEQNVRVFLQARSKVNKGIKRTIEREPRMFFAYNNGLTATAEEARVEGPAAARKLVGLRNFQIVNGGQTTASIHAAYRRKEDLSRVFVQMKLSIVSSERAKEMVPRISEYANSQNRVNAADFFANHPFHIRIEEFSRRIYAPAPDGVFHQTKWFYERARGQYADAKAGLTRARRKRFLMEYPSSQKFQKTDLAKFLNVWRRMPHIVSLGAQKNFAKFAQYVGAKWDKAPNDFNERWYRQLIAKAIVFRRTERVVSAQRWYQGGYRANIVAYAIARLAHEIEERKQAVDFQAIWRKQNIGPGLERTLAAVGRVAHGVLTSPPDGIHNVTEWAKKPACWSLVKKRPIRWSPALEAELVPHEERLRRRRAGRRDQRELNGMEALIAVVNAGPVFWQKLCRWGSQRSLLTPKEASILRAAAGGVPSERQSLVALKTLKRLRDEGYPEELPARTS